MDIATYLQSFEASLGEYSGDDPLDPWDRFIEHLEGRLPAEEKNSMSVVLDRLVQRFLQEERYRNDVRYVNHCIRCASYYSDPIKIYNYVHSLGIGTRVAILYVAWAQQFEKTGLLPQADAVYQRAMENQAEPLDAVLQQYRMFQSRTSNSQTVSSEAVRNPLQNSQLINQMPRQRETIPSQSKEPDDLSQLPADRTVRIISRSEVALSNQSSKGPAESLQFVSMYCLNDLVCEGSELCFEELRASRYFAKLKQQEELRKMEERQRWAREEEEEVRRLKMLLEELENNLGTQPTKERSFARPMVMQQEHQVQTCGPNPEFPQQSIRHPPLSSGQLPLSRRAVPSFGASCGLQAREDLPIGPGRKSESHLLQDHFRAQNTELYSSERLLHSSGPTGPVEEDKPPLSEVDNAYPTAPRAHLSDAAQAFPEAALTHLEGALQTSMLQLQSDMHSEPMATSYPVCQRTVGIPGAASGAPSLARRSLLNSSVNHFSSSFSQPSGGEQSISRNGEPELEGNVSLGGPGNLSHVTPNTSLGLVHATPSRVLPSPTVNTREALDAIMDMFQAPTFVQENLFHATAQQAEDSFETSCRITGAAPLFTQPPSAVPFAIFQDEYDKENGATALAVNKPKPARALVEIPVSKPAQQNDTGPNVESMTDETAMWGARYNSLAACPNSTRDFAMSAHLVSTPFHSNAPHSWDFKPDQENGQTTDLCASEENPYLRQPTKLSPILEQSPTDEKLSEAAECTVRGQGTIVGEGLPLPQQCQTTCSISEHPQALLSFPDHTVLQSEESPKRPATGSKACWDVYVSPEQASRPEPLHSRSPEQEREPDLDVLLGQDWTPMANCVHPKSSFHELQSERVSSESEDLGHMSHCDVPMSPEQAPKPAMDIPMSPDPAPTLDWFHVDSPKRVTEPDLDVYMRPPQTPKADSILPRRPVCPDVPMSPAQESEFDLNVAMSPAQASLPKPAPAAAVGLIPDPWDDELICSLLSKLPTPLSSCPNFTNWNCNVPNITPKMSVKMAEESLRVDFVLGRGAFATVYQATNLTTSEKLILKVQKPANPWEFYINMQLNVRLHLSVRHLYNTIHSAHLFKNGSVLLGELHNCGTLLNAVNLYKSRSEKVMPQPLVLYFTVCILHMVEQLHRAHIIHADIKPDNFLLGERFLENDCFDPENLEHGLALIDLGQSIDMTFFPEGTAFTAKCMTSGFQCTEMLSGRPWNYQTDYFGIAGTVYCMIFGTYMQVKNENGVWKTNEIFKRNPHSVLWLEFFHTMLNVPDCSSLPCLRSLRSRLNTVLQQNYSNKLRSLKNRLVVQLLEARQSRR